MQFKSIANAIVRKDQILGIRAQKMIVSYKSSVVAPDTIDTAFKISKEAAMIFSFEVITENSFTRRGWLVDQVLASVKLDDQDVASSQDFIDMEETDQDEIKGLMSRQYDHLANVAKIERLRNNGATVTEDDERIRYSTEEDTASISKKADKNSNIRLSKLSAKFDRTLVSNEIMIGDNTSVFDLFDQGIDGVKLDAEVLRSLWSNITVQLDKYISELSQ